MTTDGKRKTVLLLCILRGVDGQTVAVECSLGSWTPSPFIFSSSKGLSMPKGVYSVCGGQRAFGSAQQVSGRPYSDRLTVVCHAGLTHKNSPTITFFFLTSKRLKSVYTANRPIHFDWNFWGYLISRNFIILATCTLNKSPIFSNYIITEREWKTTGFMTRKKGINQRGSILCKKPGCSHPSRPVFSSSAGFVTQRRWCKSYSVYLCHHYTVAACRKIFDKSA